MGFLGFKRWGVDPTQWDVFMIQPTGFFLHHLDLFFFFLGGGGGGRSKFWGKIGFLEASKKGMNCKICLLLRGKHVFFRFHVTDFGDVRRCDGSAH